MWIWTIIALCTIGILVLVIMANRRTKQQVQHYRHQFTDADLAEKLATTPASAHLLVVSLTHDFMAAFHTGPASMTESCIRYWLASGETPEHIRYRIEAVQKPRA